MKAGRLRGTLVRTFLARGLAVSGSLLLIVVAGRLYGPAGVGVLALAQSLILGVGTLARYGMGGTLMRYVGREPGDPNNRIYLRRALLTALLASLLGGGLLWAFREPLEDLFQAPGLASALAGIALATPAFTLAFVLSGFFKGLRRPAAASLLENGGIALGVVPFLFLLRGLHPEGELATLGWAYALSSWLVLALAAWPLWRWHGSLAAAPAATGTLETPRVFFATSQAFFFTNLAVLLQSVVGIMLAGWLLASAELGLFKAAQQLASAVSFVLVGINAIFPPLFAESYHQGRPERLARLARQGALLGILMAAPLLLVLLLFPAAALALLGDGFEGAVPLLRVIAVAQLVNVACGSVGFVLNMTGHEVLMRNISLICALLSLSLFLILIPWLGALGAALALAAALVAQNLAAVYFVWRRLGIWTLPGFNTREHR